MHIASARRKKTRQMPSPVCAEGCMPRRLFFMEICADRRRYRFSSSAGANSLCRGRSRARSRAAQRAALRRINCTY